MKKWAKVDQTGRVVEIVDSDQQPQAEAGYSFAEATAGMKVGDQHGGHQGSAQSGKEKSGQAAGS